MTHDLLTDVISELQGEVVRVEVTELRENTYYARITIVQDGKEVEIDSRPSDAIALAVRCEARIFASEEVIAESGIEFQAEDDEQPGLVIASSLADLDPAEFRKFLETVTPEEFASSLEELEEDDEEEDRAGVAVAQSRTATDDDQRDAVEDPVEEHRRVDALRLRAHPADGEAEDDEDRERDEEAVRGAEEDAGRDDRE